MAIDLSALEGWESEDAAKAASGQPMEIPLKDIDEDPDQPRKNFDQDALAEVVASVKARGVKSPISVRPHPTGPGRWMLNYGARRYRASLAAGLNTIPAFVDISHDEYDQVVEILQRSDLAPMEMAIFIKKKLADGEKKGAIAKKLGKDSSSITHFIALIDPPAYIEDLYSTGRCTSAKVLYDLRGLHGKYPTQVEDWCSHMGDVTKRSVSELAEQLRGGKKGEESVVVGVLEATADSGTNDDSGSRSEDDSDSGLMMISSIFTESDEKDTPSYESEPHQLNSVVNKIKRPLILVEFEGRAAAVLLNRRPTAPGLIHLKYEDGDGEDEVDAGRCKINCLLDSAA